MSIPKSLVTAVREQRVVPFIGAGVSVGVKRGLFPAWKALLEQMAGFMEEEQVAGGEVERVRELLAAGDLVLAAEVAHRALGPYLFHGFLRAQYRRQRPADANLEVVRAMWALRPPLVITTNYDSALRWGAPGEVQLVANDQHEELAVLGQEASSEWPWIWHLHGTIERMATVILAGRDYKRLYEQDQRDRVASYERALFELHKTLATRSLLYIGFGLTDPYVLEQIAHVLELARGNVAPSYALMKRGEGNPGDLWASYNVRLIEYADHGAPLAALLREIAAQAFGPPAEAASVDRGLAPEGVSMGAAPPAPLPSSASRGPEPMQAFSPATPPAARGGPAAQRGRASTAEADEPIVERAALAGELAGELAQRGRLLLLAPRGGGASRLAEQIAARHYGERVIWLSPPRVPDCSEAEYCRFLAGDERVGDLAALRAWLAERARSAGGRQLVALRHDGGPPQHLGRLGDVLRALIDEPGGRAGDVHVLLAGGAQAARLRQQAAALFSDVPARRVPAFRVDEVARLLELRAPGSAPLAHDLWRATGGLPGLVALAIAGGGDLDHASVTARLARSTAVHGWLQRRLLDDERAQVPAARHARTVLRALLAGQAVQRLADLDDQLDHAEVRLYYDGLVAEDAQGETGFLCEAVRRAAADLLAGG